MRPKLAYLAIIFLATFAAAQQPAAPAPDHGHAALSRHNRQTRSGRTLWTATSAS